MYLWDAEVSWPLQMQASQIRDWLLSFLCPRRIESLWGTNPPNRAFGPVRGVGASRPYISKPSEKLKGWLPDKQTLCIGLLVRATLLQALPQTAPYRRGATPVQALPQTAPYRRGATLVQALPQRVEARV